MLQLVNEQLTIGVVLRALGAKLREHIIETPELDARVLLGHVLNHEPNRLFMLHDAVIPDETRARLDGLVTRRLAGEPIARLLGKREFYGMNFLLSPSSLIPRPDSETLIEAALRLPTMPHRFVLDLGTGPGTLLLPLLREWPQAIGVGVDRDLATLRMAAQNAKDHGLDDRASFVCDDWGKGLDGHFDLLISNPPYIARDVIDRLAVEVREHDPRLALDGGPDGLDAYRALLPQAYRLLKEGAPLLLEIGDDQEQAVIELVKAQGFACADMALRDLGDRPRILLANKLSR